MRAQGGAGGGRLSASPLRVADLPRNEPWVTNRAVVGELVKSLVTCLSAFENRPCHYNPEKAGGSLNWWIYESGEQEAENISPWFSFFLSLFFARSCKKKKRNLKPHPRESFCVLFLPASGGMAGRGAWYWHSNERIRYLSWATEFLYLILPQQADQRYLSVSLWCFYILTAEWKEQELRLLFEKEKSITCVFEALKSEHILLG